MLKHPVGEMNAGSAKAKRESEMDASFGKPRGGGEKSHSPSLGLATHSRRKAGGIKGATQAEIGQYSVETTKDLENPSSEELLLSQHFGRAFGEEHPCEGRRRRILKVRKSIRM